MKVRASARRYTKSIIPFFENRKLLSPAGDELFFVELTARVRRWRNSVFFQILRADAIFARRVFKRDILAVDLS